MATIDHGAERKSIGHALCDFRHGLTLSGDGGLVTFSRSRRRGSCPHGLLLKCFWASWTQGRYWTYYDAIFLPSVGIFAYRCQHHFECWRVHCLDVQFSFQRLQGGDSLCDERVLIAHHSTSRPFLRSFPTVPMLPRQPCILCKTKCVLPCFLCMNCIF